MLFSSIPYKRPVVQSIQAALQNLTTQFQNATSALEQIQLIHQYNEQIKELSTAENLVAIRSSIDTTNSFYEKERQFFDQQSPIFTEWCQLFTNEVLLSPFINELQEVFGKHYFTLLKNERRCFSPSIIPLLQQENEWTSAYAKKIASAQISFQGSTYTLAELGPFMQQSDRSTRQQATQAYYAFFEREHLFFDTLFQDLVHLRTQIAEQLGFNSYVEMSYIAMNRDYSPLDVQQFREAVATYIVPLTTKLYEKQRKRLDINTLYFYDEAIQFSTGNARPKGDTQWILQQGKKMYEELSPETAQFITLFFEQELFDVEAKKGKEGGGYCTFIESYQVPFIFSNFNGTSDDIDVLTHEMGHAFQVYQSRFLPLVDYRWPTYDAAEIHSMSMEFLTWPWMDSFFEEDAESYRFSHLVNAIQFIPYGVAVDAFQQFVYEYPAASIEDRNHYWKQLESTYLPHRNYDGQPYLESGRVWQRQAHIFEVPFYYIDYALAQIQAFQIWQSAEKDFESTWNHYLKLCRLGGSQPFLTLLQQANLQSPFEVATIKQCTHMIEQWLTTHSLGGIH